MKGRVLLFAAVGLLGAVHAVEAAPSWPPGYWARQSSGRRPCEWQGRAYSVTIRVRAAGEARASLDRELKAIGAVDHDADCRRQDPRGKAAERDVWIADEAVRQLKAVLIRSGDLLSWERPRETYADDTALERWTILSGELEANAALLNRTPHVRALVKAELTRLKPFRDFQKSVEGRTRFTIMVVE